MYKRQDLAGAVLRRRRDALPIGRPRDGEDSTLMCFERDQQLRHVKRVFNVAVPDAVTYQVEALPSDGSAMTIYVESGAGVFWTFDLVK